MLSRREASSTGWACPADEVTICFHIPPIVKADFAELLAPRAAGLRDPKLDHTSHWLLSVALR